MSGQPCGAPDAGRLGGPNSCLASDDISFDGMPSGQMSDTRTHPPIGSQVVRWSALAVTGAAGVATAHGLFEVAMAAGVVAPVAWLYPLITDGLALLSYAAGIRLPRRGRRYAAGLVVLAAGLSGAAQAANLAGGVHHAGAAPTVLRFGIGAWPSVAAALSAHLLHLIRMTSGADASAPPASNRRASRFEASSSASGRRTSDRASGIRPVGRSAALALGRAESRTRGLSSRPTAHERARDVARRHRDQHGALPTATQLAGLAATSRSTAGAALKTLRDESSTLHIVHGDGATRPVPAELPAGGRLLVAGGIRDTTPMRPSRAGPTTTD